jgi:hypothetical protein
MAYSTHTDHAITVEPPQKPARNDGGRRGETPKTASFLFMLSGAGSPGAVKAIAGGDGIAELPDATAVERHRRQ